MHILCFKVLNKNLKTEMTLQNVALWCIKIALWDIFLCIAMKFFSDVKNVLFYFQLV